MAMEIPLQQRQSSSSWLTWLTWLLQVGPSCGYLWGLFWAGWAGPTPPCSPGPCWGSLAAD